jgi:4-amino-4-deoxy-L-arabinose transferase-like glycosyltransferase
MERWISRLWLSFIVVAAVLAWEAYKAHSGQRGPVGQGRILLYVVGAAASFSLGMLGVRIRHRKDRF